MADEKLNDTLVSMFCRRVAADGDKPALHIKRGDKFVAVHLEPDRRRRAAHGRGAGASWASSRAIA